MFLVASFILFFIWLYMRGTKNHKYWKKKGIKFCKPVPFFGNSLRKYLQKISPTDSLVEIYKEFPNESYVGCYECNHPALVLRDPELIKHVLVTDFHHFYLKGMNVHQNEPLMNNLFSADGDIWKLMRQKLSSAFTTGQLKRMFHLISERSERMVQVVNRIATKTFETNVRDLTARYSLDVIVACGFGVDTNSINKQPNIFHKIGKRIFTITPRDALVNVCKFVAPELFKHLHFFAPEIESDMHFVVKNILKNRSNNIRNQSDFMDILMAMQQRGKLIGDSITKMGTFGIPEKAEVVLDDKLLTAQAFILFGAGYETTSAAISHTLHQLAFNQDIQKKCQKEIDAVLESHGELTYEAVKQMKYLSMVFHESLRMYPPIGFLIRQCARKYTFPGTKLSIEKGVAVLIPVQALHYDSNYFQEPEKFNPDRFHPDNLNAIKNHVYMPFGEGPRTCIGYRLGLLVSLTGLASILKKYTVLPSTNSRARLTTDSTTALVQNVKGGIPLTFVEKE